MENETEEEKFKNVMQILERFLLWEVSDQTGHAISSWCHPDVNSILCDMNPYMNYIGYYVQSHGYKETKYCR